MSGEITDAMLRTAYNYAIGANGSNGDKELNNTAELNAFYQKLDQLTEAAGYKDVVYHGTDPSGKGENVWRIKADSIKGGKLLEHNGYQADLSKGDFKWAFGSPGHFSFTYDSLMTQLGRGGTKPADNDSSQKTDKKDDVKPLDEATQKLVADLKDKENFLKLYDAWDPDDPASLDKDQAPQWAALLKSMGLDKAKLENDQNPDYEAQWDKLEGIVGALSKTAGVQKVETEKVSETTSVIKRSTLLSLLGNENAPITVEVLLAALKKDGAFSEFDNQKNPDPRAVTLALYKAMGKTWNVLFEKKYGHPLTKLPQEMQEQSNTVNKILQLYIDAMPGANVSQHTLPLSVLDELNKDLQKYKVSIFAAS